MTFEFAKSLQKFNTFGFDVTAEKVLIAKDESSLLNALKGLPEPRHWQILGGGSNVVLVKDLPNLTILMKIAGKAMVSETETTWHIEVGAGENWHNFVKWAISEGFAGLENLALIPGTCGAAPIQNIGAYGAEVAQFIDEVRVLDTHKLDSSDPWLTLNKEACQFAYRDSIFKHTANRYIVTKVRFAIPKHWQANLNYAELAKELSTINEPNASQIFNAVCAIRERKLPNPEQIGNAGSFFHNTVVSSETYLQLKERFPNIVAHPYHANFKLAAGWLIDQCGFKGFTHKHVGVYEKQALVLVNHGNGNGTELLELAELIKAKVKETYGVHLTQEPIILP